MKRRQERDWLQQLQAEANKGEPGRDGIAIALVGAVIVLVGLVAVFDDDWPMVSVGIALIVVGSYTMQKGASMSDRAT